MAEAVEANRSVDVGCVDHTADVLLGWKGSTQEFRGADEGDGSCVLGSEADGLRGS